MVCTLLVPKSMSKSSNSCSSHTCQISISLSSLWRPWRAAAPLPAGSNRSSGASSDFVQPPGERGRWSWRPASLRAGSWPGAKPPAAAFHLLHMTPVSAGYRYRNKSGLRITALMFVLYISVWIRVYCSLTLQGTEQRKAVEIMMGGGMQRYHYLYQAVTDALLKADHGSCLRIGTGLTNSYF